jgi:hypothetical protein
MVLVENGKLRVCGLVTDMDVWGEILTWQNLKSGCRFFLKILPNVIADEKIMNQFLISQKVLSMRAHWSIEVILRLGVSAEKIFGVG